MDTNAHDPIAPGGLEPDKQRDRQEEARRLTIAPQRQHKLATGAIISALAALSALAGLPVPSFVYYGEVVDEYGWPVTAGSEATIVAGVGGRECGHSLLHEGRGPAINYRVEVPIDDGRGAHYADHAARTGDTVTFTVLIDGTEYAVMDPATIPPVGSPGERVRRNLCIGEDADGDGFPDAWEEWILLWGTGGATNILDVRGEDDTDGDGMSNRDEYIAGTDPTWNHDCLQIEDIRRFADQGQIGLAFHSVPGKTYRVSEGRGIGAMATTVPIATNRNATTASADYWRGNGYYSWIYIEEKTNTSAFIRLTVE
jgi:hypothetical protein